MDDAKKAFDKMMALRDELLTLNDTMGYRFSVSVCGGVGWCQIEKDNNNASNYFDDTRIYGSDHAMEHRKVDSDGIMHVECVDDIDLSRL